MASFLIICCLFLIKNWKRSGKYFGLGSDKRVRPASRIFSDSVGVTTLDDSGFIVINARDPIKFEVVDVTIYDAGSCTVRDAAAAVTAVWGVPCIICNRDADPELRSERIPKGYTPPRQAAKETDVIFAHA